jgi:hypothetical protein
MTEDLPGEPHLQIRITPEDYTSNGLIKGDLIFQIMENSKQSLTKIASALHENGEWFSLMGFIQAARESGKYGAWSLKKILVKAIKDVLPEMVESDGWPDTHRQIKKEIQRAYERPLH